jgi:hypothetical protein
MFDKFGKLVVLGCGGLIASVVVVGIIFGIWYFGTFNKQARFVAQISGEQDVCKISYDNTWKVIQEMAQVPDAYKDGFKESWGVIVNSSPSKTAGLVNAYVTRFNPKFDSKLYEKLMVTIEHQRKSFAEAQKKLRALKTEHDAFRTTMPVDSMLGRMLFGTFPPIEVQLVLSEKTDNAFETGRDDKINVFDRKPATVPTAS